MMLVPLILSSCVLLGSGAVVKVDESLTDDIINAVEKQIKFFSADYSDINVDGLFGLRMGQGQLSEAVNFCSKSPSCSRKYLSTLKDMESRVGQASDKALPYVEQSDPAYYKRFLVTISKPWILPYQPKTFGVQDMNSIQVGKNDSYDEDYGDACYARVLGTFNNTPACTVTPACWKFMTTGDTSHYAVTHQLLYFIVIEHVGCLKQVEKKLHGEKVRDVQAKKCMKIYKEAEALISNNNVKSINRDLFLEQSVLCGLLGFENFFREDWMRMTLKWLDTRVGCFRITLPQLEQLTDEMVDQVDQMAGITNKTEIHQEKLKEEEITRENYYKQESKENQKSSDKPTMRKLLREKGMKDNCLSHTSGLGFGVFSSYLHYLVRNM